MSGLTDMHSPAQIAAKRGKKVEDLPWLRRKSERRHRQGPPGQGPARLQRRHRLSVRALGLSKLNDVRELKDSPQVRGLINKVHYLVRVEE